MIAVLRLLGFDGCLILSMQPMSVKVVDLIKPKPVRENGDEAKMKPDANLNDDTKEIGKKSVGSPQSMAKTAEKSQNEVGDAKKKRKLKSSAKKDEKSGDSDDGAKKTRLEVEEDDREENELDIDSWKIEVYFEKKQIFTDSHNDCETKHPFIYRVSFDNKVEVNTTLQYATNSLDCMPRCDFNWLMKLILLMQQQKVENVAIDEENYSLKESLPKTIGEPAPFEFMREEGVFDADCIQSLRSRQFWQDESKTIRAGEKPFKIVISRTDWKLGLRNMDLPSDIFGEWQMSDYVRPIASNSKVPRNGYGNVDMFKKCMLPGGTVHLRVPRLLKVARELGIDCAPALTGWDFLKAGNRPIFDGWIVCALFEKLLMEAWRQQMKLKIAADHPEMVPSNFIGDVALHSRGCVHTPEAWRCQGRIVKTNEERLGTVATQPQFDMEAGLVESSDPYDIFGGFQTRWEWEDDDDDDEEKEEEEEEEEELGAGKKYGF